MYREIEGETIGVTGLGGRKGWWLLVGGGVGERKIKKVLVRVIQGKERGRRGRRGVSSRCGSSTVVRENGGKVAS